VVLRGDGIVPTRRSLITVDDECVWLLLRDAEVGDSVSYVVGMTTAKFRFGEGAVIQITGLRTSPSAHRLNATIPR